MMEDLQSLGVSDGWFVLALERKNGADFSISSNLGQQLPGNSCANVVGSFAVGTTYRDIGNYKKLNDYHRLRRWVSKDLKARVNSGGQFDQLCNLIDGAILARALR